MRSPKSFFLVNSLEWVFLKIFLNIHDDVWAYKLYFLYSKKFIKVSFFNCGFMYPIRSSFLFIILVLWYVPTISGLLSIYFNWVRRAISGLTQEETCENINKITQGLLITHFPIAPPPAIQVWSSNQRATYTPLKCLSLLLSALLLIYPAFWLPLNLRLAHFGFNFLSK